ncbi:Uncharacterised protein [Shimwellia blattae]|nr:Uncharacterised protein [Shimwellia blattae]VEC23628.1 Uncharacterised protein [Shimwellia blattae]
MCEDVFAAAFGTDKPKPFGVIEPFNSTRLHAVTSFEIRIDGMFRCVRSVQIIASSRLYNVDNSDSASRDVTGPQGEFSPNFEAVNAIGIIVIWFA